ncbi:MAG: NAD(P)/FAD-dependent oxidoreductase [Isosphaeraceae bacterium]|nr:NAD(P)/FAD-dependent oxidoreductase [Isosphaeraceae bacterium]
MSQRFDLVILGAGAAGLMAAIAAAESGASVLLAEKNRRPGVKILMSGGTRCNLTNARGLRDLRVISGPIDPAYDPREARGARSIQQAFGENGKFLGPALKAFSVEESVAFFEREGVPTKVEGNGKVFPVSDRATDVLSALTSRLERSGATLRTLCPASEVRAIDDGFNVALPDGPVEAAKVMVATGGLSFPGSGTTGDGYAIARAFGHTIVPTRPSLVPLTLGPSWVKSLSGLTLPDAGVGVRSRSGLVLDDRREALLFAHFGLTGPAVLDVSRSVARWDADDPLDLVLDFLPDANAEKLDASIRDEARKGKRPAAGLVPPSIPRRLVDEILRAAGIPEGRLGPDLSRDERRGLVAQLKGMALPITGTLGYAKAEVTSGGVALDEVDPKTLESRRRPGLYFIGEVLDLDGRIGGYNFQGAWSMGILAGRVAASRDGCS